MRVGGGNLVALRERLDCETARLQGLVKLRECLHIQVKDQHSDPLNTHLIVTTMRALLALVNWFCSGGFGRTRRITPR